MTETLQEKSCQTKVCQNELEIFVTFDSCNNFLLLLAFILSQRCIVLQFMRNLLCQMSVPHSTQAQDGGQHGVFRCPLTNAIVQRRCSVLVDRTVLPSNVPTFVDSDFSELVQHVQQI